jgi:hypothetical protein
MRLIFDLLDELELQTINVFYILNYIFIKEAEIFQL